MKTDFEIAHEYFKKIFSGNDPMKKQYTSKDFPNINKLLIRTTKKEK